MINLLNRGNTKVGESIYTWSLPAVTTCPGRSPVCESACYARKGRYRTHRLQLALAANMQASTESSFSTRMIKEVRRRGCHVVRIHVSGDFYSADYTRTWTEIARACRRTRFYAYTRSWRISTISLALEEFSTLPNTRLWLSCDWDTGLPLSPLANTKLCWLQTTEDEQIPQGIDLVFRNHTLRPIRPTHFPLKLICPPERPNPPADASCSSCGKCWS